MAGSLTIRPAGGSGRLARDPGERQRLRVDDPRRPPLVQDRMLGRDRVELRAGGETPLGEPGREGVADDDPGPGRLGLHAIGDVRLDVGQRAIRRDRVVLLAAGRAQRVDVAVVQAGQERPALRVDGLRRRPGQGVGLGVRAHDRDPVAPDRHRLGDPRPAVDRDHLGVADDHVGPRRASSARARRGTMRLEERGTRTHAMASVGGDSVQSSAASARILR